MIQKETIYRFIEGKASLREQKEVLDWIESSPENRKEFARLKNLSVAADILVLERKRTAFFGKNVLLAAMKVAAVVVAAVSVFLLGSAAQEYRWEKLASEQFTELVAPYGEVLHFTLPDSSKVVLNGGSSLKFSKLFNEGEREVYLSGEGYFEVKKGAEIFNVVYPMEAPRLKLSVLGTKFNISSYEGKDDIVTTLYEGAVAIENLDTKENIELDTFTKHIYGKSSGVSVVEQFTETYKWTDKYVIAKDEDILTLTRRLEEIFGVRIIVDERLAGNCSYTGALYGGSLQQILDNMTFVSPIKYSIEDSGKTVIIEHK